MWITVEVVKTARRGCYRIHLWLCSICITQLMWYTSACWGRPCVSVQDMLLWRFNPPPCQMSQAPQRVTTLRLVRYSPWHGQGYPLLACECITLTFLRIFDSFALWLTLFVGLSYYSHSESHGNGCFKSWIKYLWQEIMFVSCFLEATIKTNWYRLCLVGDERGVELFWHEKPKNLFLELPKLWRSLKI